jgi:hypothetical protein
MIGDAGENVGEPSNPSAKVPSFRARFAEDCIADRGEFGADEFLVGTTTEETSSTPLG